MPNPDLLQNINGICDFSKIIYNSISDSSALFNYIQQLPPNVKLELQNRYSDSNGPVLGFRRQVIDQVVSGNLEREKIVADFEKGKKDNPRQYTQYKNLYSILYPFVIYGTNDMVLKSLTELTKNLREELGITEKTSIKVSGFGGVRNTGGEDAWFAIYNNSHPNQTMAKQLFFSICNGRILYALYDRAIDNFIEKEEIDPAQFVYENMLQFYLRHKEVMLNDNFRAYILNKYSIRDLIQNLTSEAITAWLIKPGKKAFMWKQALEEENIRIGWGAVVREIIATSNYSEDFVLDQLNGNYPTDTTQHNNKNSILFFLKDLGKGDIIFAVSGQSQIVGIGIVTSDIILDDEGEEYTATRNVDWIIDLQKAPYTPNYGLPIKTVTSLPSKDAIDILTAVFNTQNLLNPNNMVQSPVNVILYGPPGTGKTYHTINHALAIIENKTIEVINEEEKAGRDKLIGRFEEYRRNKLIEFITFHQNYSYEEFVQGLRPKIDSLSQLLFEKKEGVFKKIADEALKNLEASKSQQTVVSPEFNEVFEEFFRPLIDETNTIKIQMESPGYVFELTKYNLDLQNINFTKQSGGKGHTIYVPTLKLYYEQPDIDHTRGLRYYYRPLAKAMLAQAEKMKKILENVERRNFVLIIDEINRANISRVFGELITLIEEDKRWGNQHQLKISLPSGDEFTVPKNLYIIGTMNTADKSIALIDIALRRRFVFKDIYPREELIDQLVTPPYNEFLKQLNRKIKELKGADFMVGHAYFIPEKGKNLEILEIMNRKVIPLLNEYFYNQRNNPVYNLLKPLEYCLNNHTIELDAFIGTSVKSIIQ